MAVALTNEQRDIMRVYPRFQSLIKGAISEKSKFWMDPAIVEAPPGGDRIKWARSRNLGADLIHAPDTYQAARTESQAAIFLKDIQVNPSEDQAVFVIDDVINFMLAHDTFDALAEAVFDEQIKGRIGF